MRCAAFLLALALAVTAQAQSVKDYPWMTGERLLQLYDGPVAIRSGHGKWTQEEIIELQKESNLTQADAYMDGVHDATEGRLWCWSAKYHPKPDTLHGQIIWELRKMPVSQRKRNAADLIAEIWAQKWPCEGKR